MRVGYKNLSLGITVCNQAASLMMANCNLWDRFFYHHHHTQSIPWASLMMQTVILATDLSILMDSYILAHQIRFSGLLTCVNKVSKGAKIWNRYNQAPHLTQDTNGKVTNSQYTPQMRAKRSALSQQVTTKHI